MKDALVTHEKTYLPAAGHDLFLPFYDLATKLIGAARLWRELVNQAALQPGQRALEIGCGTGSLTVLAKTLHPEVEIVGLDPDPKALARARRKAQRAGVSLQFTEGFSQSLPYADTRFDHVFSSFMFHHLESDTRQQTLREVRRVLKPGASLHLLDFNGPESGRQGLLMRWLHSHHRLQDNSESRILALMEQAGFSEAEVAGRRPVFFGLAEAVRYRAMK